MVAKTKRHLILAPTSKNGVPTLDDLIALARTLSGREPTPEEIEEARDILAQLDPPRIVH